MAAGDRGGGGWGPNGAASGRADTRGARARALTCAGNSAEAAAATAAATGSQADEANQALALAREKPQATAADVLIYPGRRRCACALGAGSSAQARRALGGRAGVGSVGAGAAGRDPASRGRRPGGGGVGAAGGRRFPSYPCSHAPSGLSYAHFPGEIFTSGTQGPAGCLPGVWERGPGAGQSPEESSLPGRMTVTSSRISLPLPH